MILIRIIEGHVYVPQFWTGVNPGQSKTLIVYLMKVPFNRYLLCNILKLLIFT